MTTLLAINGMIDQETLLQNVDLPDLEDLAWFPNLRVALGGPHDPDRAFELVVRSVVDGVDEQLRNGPKKRPAAKGPSKPRKRR